MAPFKTPYGFCEWVENELGWAVPSETPEIRRKALIAETAKVKRRIASMPGLYTWDNLALTVTWLKKKRKTTTPWGVLGWVQVALRDSKTRAEQRPADIAVAISTAIATEQATRRPGYEEWVRRLTRAQGAGRQAVYEEWETERSENP